MSSASLVKNQTIEIIKIIRKHISVFIKKLQFSSIWKTSKQKRIFLLGSTGSLKFTKECEKKWHGFEIK